MTMTTLPPAPDAPALAPADDAQALIARECRHVAGETVPGLRMAALIAAGLNLGKQAGVALETAAAALTAAAQAGNYPAEIEGEEVASIIRRWLWTGRQQVPDWDRERYRDWALRPPKAPLSEAPAPQEPAPDAEIAALAPAAEAAVPAQEEVPTVPEIEAAPVPPVADPDLGPVILAQELPEPDPDPLAVGDSILLRADAVTPEPVDWLWKHHIARGKLTLIGGAPGSGKSTLALGLIAAVSSGGAWPGGEGHAAQGSAILVCEAASLRDTIVPGLMAAGADRSRVGLIADVRAKEGGRRPFDLHTDLALLESAIQSLPDVRLLVIDPVNAFAGADAAREDRLGALLHPLAALAEKHAVAIVVVAHPVKGNYLKPNVTSLGAAALKSAARMSFLVHTDPIDPRRRLLLAVKNNLAADRGALAFTIERREAGPGVTGPLVVWERRRFRLAPDDVIGPGAKTRSAKADARGFLHHLLADRPAIPVAEIEAEARAAGLLSARQPISQCRPLRDARLALKLVVMREGFGADGHWVWAREEPRSTELSSEERSQRRKQEKRQQRIELKRQARAEAKAAAQARSSMEKRTSMETTSMPNVPAPALVPGQL